MVRRWAASLLLALVAFWACGNVAAAAPKLAKKDSSATCKPSSGKEVESADKDDDDDDDDDEGVRFDLAGACAKLTGGVSYTYQQAKKSASGLPTFVNRNGTVSAGSFANALSANVGLETTRQTSLGEFKTSFSANWSKATGDAAQNGAASISGWSVGLAGLTVGYTGTLMSFWEGDFISTANAPGRTANTVVYEYEFGDQHKVAVGLESSLPTTRQSEPGFRSFDFSEPVYTVRWLRETDPWTMHLSGLVRQADFSNSPLLPLLPNTATVRTGWAASLGSKISVPFVAEDDEASFQVTYAVDASSYLGINTDLTTFQNIVRSTGPTVGWSAVASYHHVWSEQFESNLFGSYVTLRADLLLVKPEAQTFRSGVNLFWKPMDHLKFGIELGYVEMKLDPHGILGFFNGSSGHAWTGYFSVSAEL